MKYKHRYHFKLSNTTYFTKIFFRLQSVLCILIQTIFGKSSFDEIHDEEKALIQELRSQSAIRSLADDIEEAKQRRCDIRSSVSVA